MHLYPSSTRRSQFAERFSQDLRLRLLKFSHPHRSINVLDDEALLNVFYHYRPVLLLDEDEDDNPGSHTLHRREWDRERWWYKPAHVCRRWRYLVLRSTSYLGLRLYCTRGTPIADMLAYSPPIPLVLDYVDKDHNVTTKDERGIALALQQCDRVHRIRLDLPFSTLQRLVMAMDDEFPMLEYLYVGPPTKHNTGLVLPQTFRAPHLRHFILLNFSFSVTSPLLMTAAAGLVTLVLQGIHPSAYFRPATLLRRLSLLQQLEILMIAFVSPIHNSDHERQLLHTPAIMHTTLPNLRWLGFKGASAYLEALLPHITTHQLERLQISFFNQLIFSTPHLLQFLNEAENLRFVSAVLTFREEAVWVNVYPSEEARKCTFALEVGGRHLDWQVASAAQIFNGFGTLYSAVDHLTLEYEGSSKLSDPHHEDDRMQWRELLGSFINVKTLSVPSSLIGELSHSLILNGESPLELLPGLKELVCPAGRDGRDGDAFTPFIDARQAAGRPVLLVRTGLPVDNSPQHAKGNETPRERALRTQDSLTLERTCETADPPPDPRFKHSNINTLDSVNDIYIDGFLAHTFSPQDIHHFLTLLLRTPDFMRYYRISYAEGVWHIMRDPSSGVPSQGLLLPLDFSVKLNPGTVIPQQRWTIADGVDVRRHIEEATLQLPIFFAKRKGGVGFWLPDILQGNDHDLCNRDNEAPLGGVITTYIYINWPGYDRWRRHIVVREETLYKNPITLGRFMRHVGTSVDRFFNAMASGNGVNPNKWEIGPHGITQRHVKIIGAVHVSAWGWMPLIQLTGYLP